MTDTTNALDVLDRTPARNVPELADTLRHKSADLHSLAAGATDPDEAERQVATTPSRPRSRGDDPELSWVRRQVAATMTDKD